MLFFLTKPFMRNDDRGESMNAPQSFETARDARIFKTHLPAAVLYKKVSPSMAVSAYQRFLRNMNIRPSTIASAAPKAIITSTSFVVGFLTLMSEMNRMPMITISRE